MSKKSFLFQTGLAFFLCLFAGCQANSGIEHSSKEVLILCENVPEIEEIGHEIQKKIDADYLVFDYDWNEDKEEVKKNLFSYQLILIGGTQKEKKISETMKSVLEEIDLKEKRVAPFWLLDEEGEDTLKLEKELKNLEKEAVLLPGIGLTWEKEERKEELTRIDGWLTTAFTYEIEKNGNK